jgi:aminopeptidase-like protein
MLWVLNQSDGTKSLLDIEELSSISFKNLHEAALLLEEHALLN